DQWWISVCLPRHVLLYPDMPRPTISCVQGHIDFTIENLNLIGLNTIDAKTLRNISYRNDYKNLEEVHYVPSRLNPYYSDHHAVEHLPEIKSKYPQHRLKWVMVAEVFIDDLYMVRCD
ncbi:MAG: hypothetical protein IPP34_09615, partial [Bacteroidetes bacterium]|nr:hypothetical protein [Bacteroidota bacterium]